MNEDVIIRPVLTDEANRLEDFLASNGGENLRSLARQYIAISFSNEFRKPTFIVAVNATYIVGCAAYSEQMFSMQTWGIHWVHVHVSHRHRGLGQKLVECCIDKIDAMGNEPISIILATYPNGAALYERSGFEKATQNCQGGWFMVKNVVPHGRT